MNRILVLEELESFVYNKCFELYSILFDGWRIVLELLGEGYFEKIFYENFWKSNPIDGKGVKFTE